LPQTWERLISDIQGLDESTGQDFATFYAKCLRYNSLGKRRLPA
jgi:hypothetical protein